MTISTLSKLKLKVKVKSLAEEARIIREEERKTTVPMYKNSLHEHRVWDVRNECRATQLAIAFLEGVPYKVLERSLSPGTGHMFGQYIVPRVHKIAAKYGNFSYQDKKNDVVYDKIREWYTTK